MTQETSFLTLADRTLAYQRYDASRQTKTPVFFLGGFASDMNGTKASFLAEKCAEDDRSLMRFDYRGHGESSDDFINGTIGAWFHDALQIFDQLTAGKQLLVGSSMGGWIGLLLARARPDRVAGFIGVAAAPDFTEDLIIPSLTPAQNEALAKDGCMFEDGVPEDRRVPITAKLLEEARQNLVLRGPLDLSAPVHLLQGQLDKDVPWRTAIKTAEGITSPSVLVTLVKDGDHSLSRPQDLALLWDVVQKLG